MKGRRPCRPSHPITKFGSDSTIPQEHPSHVTSEETCNIWQRKWLWLWICQLKLLPLPFFAVFHRAAKVQKRTNALIHCNNMRKEKKNLPGGIKTQIRALNGGSWSGIWRKVLYGHLNLQWNVSTAVRIQNLHEIGATVWTIVPRTEKLPETPTQIMLGKVWKEKMNAASQDEWSINTRPRRSLCGFLSLFALNKH